MVRFEIPGSPISVAYGCSDVAGVFLSVFDSRLRYDANATDAVNDVTECIGVRDGGGSYFDLHTDQIGFGIKVDHATMATYLRRFGVSEEQIRSLPLNLPPPSHLAGVASRLCPVCIGKVASKACSRCHAVQYCSKQCQEKDWSFHKLFCNIGFSSSASSTTLDGETSIQALLLPSDSKTPLRVRIPHEWTRLGDDDVDNGYGEYFWHLTMDEFIPQYASTVRSDRFPHEKQQKLKSGFHVAYKDDFLVDGISKQNECIQHIFKQKKCAVLPSHWRGNVLLIKSEKGEYNPKYEDLLTYGDIMDAVDFLIDYSVAKYDA